MKAHQKRHSDVDGWKHNYTYYRISKVNIQKMKTLKQSYNFRSYDALINFLILSHNSNDYPIATPEIVMRDSVPIILSGLPGAGKTTFVRDLISRLDGPLFLFDAHDEYLGLAKINLGEFFSLDFRTEKRKLRLLLSTNIEIGKSEADSIFRHMLMFQKQLSRWIIVVEEGQRYTESLLLKSLLAEARKHMRKMIVVAHQVESYKGLGIILRVSR